MSEDARKAAAEARRQKILARGKDRLTQITQGAPSPSPTDEVTLSATAHDQSSIATTTTSQSTLPPGHAAAANALSSEPSTTDPMSSQPLFAQPTDEATLTQAPDPASTQTPGPAPAPIPLLAQGTATPATSIPTSTTLPASLTSPATTTTTAPTTTTTTPIPLVPTAATVPAVKLHPELISSASEPQSASVAASGLTKLSQRAISQQQPAPSPTTAPLQPAQHTPIQDSRAAAVASPLVTASRLRHRGVEVVSEADADDHGPGPFPADPRDDVPLGRGMLGRTGAGPVPGGAQGVVLRHAVAVTALPRCLLALVLVWALINGYLQPTTQRLPPVVMLGVTQEARAAADAKASRSDVFGLQHVLAMLWPGLSNTMTLVQAVTETMTSVMDVVGLYVVTAVVVQAMIAGA